MKKVLKQLLASLVVIVFVMSCAVFMVGCSNENQPAVNPNEPENRTEVNEPESETSIKRNDVKISEDSFDGKTFPFIYVDVADSAEIVSKEEYLSCVVRVTNTDEAYVFDGENAQNAKIKGRGNTSWRMPKKSYKLKFDKKVDLFGFGKAKKWTLIANYCDKSLSRNLMAYRIANAIGLTETTQAQPVNLMVNGDYYGVYLLCEQNEIGKNRVDIESNLQDIDTGYLLELDTRAPEEGIKDVDYFVVDYDCYAIKDPETDDANFTSEHLNFIKSYLQDCYDALESGDFERVKALIDVESFAKCYLVQELFNNVDIGKTSNFFYKNKGEKLFAGPLWDFDVSSGNWVDYQLTNNPNYLCGYHSYCYSQLLKFDEFRNLTISVLSEYSAIITIELNRVYDYQMQYLENNNVNFDVWQIMGTSANFNVWKYPVANDSELVLIDTFQGQLEYLKTWLADSLTYLLSVYSSDIPYSEGRAAIDFSNINIKNMPMEKERICEILDKCIIGFDNYIEVGGTINWEWVDVYNFLQKGDNLCLDTINSDVVMSSKDLRLNLIDCEGYNLCIVEFSDDPNVNFVSEIYFSILQRKLLIAAIYNNNLPQKIRYNFLYHA